MNWLKPQLAKPVEKWLPEVKAFPNRFCLEPKLDGHRRLVTRRMCWSRDGHEHQHTAVQACVPEGVMLDGEIVVKDRVGGSHDVTHLLTHDPSALKFVCFDLLYLNGLSIMSETLRWRRSALLQAFRSGVVHVSDVVDCSIDLSLGGFERAVEWCAEAGLEGLMVKRWDAPYSPGSRSTWMKHKFVQTYDVVVVDAEGWPTEWRVRPGEEDTDGTILPTGSPASSWALGWRNLRYGYYDQNGKLRVVGELGMTGPPEELQRHVGKVAEIRSFGPQYPTGALRHPGFIGWRDGIDLELKDPRECTFDFGR